MRGLRTNTTIQTVDISSTVPLKDKMCHYIRTCFEIAIILLKSNYSNKLINGPISKKNFLKKKFLGITEYFAKKFNKKKVAMLIYNNDLSVSPLTTHLPLKMGSKKFIAYTMDLTKNYIEINADYRS